MLLYDILLVEFGNIYIRHPIVSNPQWRLANRF